MRAIPTQASTGDEEAQGDEEGGIEDQDGHDAQGVPREDGHVRSFGPGKKALAGQQGSHDAQQNDEGPGILHGIDVVGKDRSGRSRGLRKEHDTEAHKQTSAENILCFHDFSCLVLPRGTMEPLQISSRVLSRM